MLFLLRPAQCLSPELVCVREPAICCVWACSAYVWAREERRDSQLCRASAPEIPVCLELPGAKETKAQMLPVDCSLGLHLSLGIHKPIYSQHRTQLCSGPTFLLSWPCVCVCVCARAQIHQLPFATRHINIFQSVWSEMYVPYLFDCLRQLWQEDLFIPIL